VQMTREEPSRERDLTPKERVRFNECVKALVDLFEREKLPVPVADRIKDNVREVMTLEKGTPSYTPLTKKLLIPPGESQEDDVLRIHEAGHAISHTKEYEAKRGDGPYVLRNGVMINIARPRALSSLFQTTPQIAAVQADRYFRDTFFRALMEGINDAQAYRAFRESSDLADRTPLNMNIGSYRNERELVYLIIDRISNYLKLPQSAIERMFLETHNFGWTKACKKALLETFGPNALRVLAVLETETYVAEIERDPDVRSYSRMPTFRRDGDLIQDFFGFSSIERREVAAQKILQHTRIPYKPIPAER